MSIFRRIYDITRAHVSAQLENHGPKTKRDHSKTKREKTRRHTSSGSSHRSSAPPPPPPPEATELEKAYAALEIPVGSDLKTAKRAWRDQLRKYHPDLHSSDAEKQKIAHDVSQQLNKAYDTIRDHLSS